MSPRARSRISRTSSLHEQNFTHGLLVESVGAPYLTYIKKQCLCCLTIGLRRRSERRSPKTLDGDSAKKGKGWNGSGSGQPGQAK